MHSISRGELHLRLLLFLRPEFSGKSTHLFGYGFVDDFGVDLSRANVGMSEHSGDDLHRHAISQCETSERVSGDVHGKGLVDATYSCYLAEIRVHTLVGDDWK